MLIISRNNHKFMFAYRQRSIFQTIFLHSANNSTFFCKFAKILSALTLCGVRGATTERTIFRKNR